MNPIVCECRRGRVTGALLLWLALTAVAVAAPEPTSSEAAFSQGMHQIMARMDVAMMAPSAADVDAEFIAMMVPHHQAAVDMAVLELRYGHNPQLARLAQEIIVDQQQEIAVMRRIGQGTP